MSIGQVGILSIFRFGRGPWMPGQRRSLALGPARPPRRRAYLVIERNPP
jgi:hypothetical protein